MKDNPFKVGDRAKFIDKDKIGPFTPGEEYEVMGVEAEFIQVRSREGGRSGGWCHWRFEPGGPSIDAQITELRCKLAALEEEKIREEVAVFDAAKKRAIESWQSYGAYCDKLEVDQGEYKFNFSFERRKG